MSELTERQKFILALVGTIMRVLWRGWLCLWSSSIT
jgi:hypothetical protein